MHIKYIQDLHVGQVFLVLGYLCVCQWMCVFQPVYLRWTILYIAYENIQVDTK